MPTFKKIEDINVWKESIDLVLYAYKLINQSKTFQKDYGFKDQVQRSAVSIPSNISEGFERETNAEFIRFLYIAKGSCGELRTQLLIAYKLGYINEENFNYADDKCRHIASMIANLIKSLKTCQRANVLTCLRSIV